MENAMEKFRTAWGAEGLTFILLVQSFISQAPEFREKQNMAEAIRDGLNDLSEGLSSLTRVPPEYTK